MYSKLYLVMHLFYLRRQIYWLDIFCYYTSHTFFYINFIAIKILFSYFHSICLKSTIQRWITQMTIHRPVNSTLITSCNNVAPVTNLYFGRATTRSHSSQWSKKRVAVENIKTHYLRFKHFIITITADPSPC